MTVLGQAVPVLHKGSVYPDFSSQQIPSLRRVVDWKPDPIAWLWGTPWPKRGAQGSSLMPTVCLWHGLALPGCAVTTPCSLLAFRALLQIRAVRKKPGALSPVSFSPVLAQSVDHDEHSVSTW